MNNFILSFLVFVVNCWCLDYLLICHAEYACKKCVENVMFTFIFKYLGTDHIDVWKEKG
ncbi:hypothetical protein BsLM_3515 [Bacillus sp. LM 4-2]|nr:hypothetical protein BsLM_3515 [Bacillus sp. LM 4-2]